MSIVLIIVGVVLVGVGVWFAWANKASDKAGGSGMKSLSIEGPAWLVLIVVGLASAGWGVVRWEDRNPPKTNEDREAITTAPTIPPTIPGDDIDEFLDEYPTGFTLGDNNELDKLWRECERGIWASCDALYFQSDPGSDYEWFGATCGGIIPEPIDFCDPTTE